MRLTLLATMLFAVMMVGCKAQGGGADDDTTGGSSPGCGECSEEIADIRSRLKALYGVRQLLTVTRYSASCRPGPTTSIPAAAPTPPMSSVGANARSSEPVLPESRKSIE